MSKVISNYEGYVNLFLPEIRKITIIGENGAVNRPDEVHFGHSGGERWVG